MTSHQLEKKRYTIDKFVTQLVQSDVGKYIAKILLFGSVLKGTAHEDSDIDLMVIAKDLLPKVKEVCANTAFEILLKEKEGIEIVVHCLHEWRLPKNFLIWEVKSMREEVYTLKDTEIKKAESERYLILAQHYLETAERNFAAKDFRVAVDLGYNASELCVKGLLVFELDEMPSSHRGFVIKFRELYIQTGRLEKGLGRRLNIGLGLCNNARYESNAILTEKDAEEIIDLAESLTNILKKELERRGLE